MSTPQNPLMQQAAGMFANPNAAAVPQQQPGVIDSQKHHVIAAIIQALSQGMQNYGMTAMDPRERLQRQEMDAQKAEAMARLGAQQEQLGMEHQRVGFEGQRTAADVVRSGAEANRANVEAAEAPKRTNIEKQRADQEYAAKKTELDRQERQFQAEFGVGGLKSQELGIQKGQLDVAKRRASAEEQMNQIIKARDEAEAQYHQDAIRAQGLQTDRTALEDERKARYKVADDTMDKHFWFFDSKESLLAAKNKKHAEIDADINSRIAGAEKAAGTGAGARAAAGPAPQGGDSVTVISNGVRGTMPRANLPEAQKRDPNLQVVP